MAAPCGRETAENAAAIGALIALRRRLLDDDGHLDTQSEKGAEACGHFLSAVEDTAQLLRLEAAPRAYRAEFSKNYRSLFEGETRSYRVDILEAGTSLNQHPVIWANGEEYELSEDAMLRAEELTRAWVELCDSLDSWAEPSPGSPPMPKAFDHAAFEAVLAGLDRAWASFECSYIAELMKVQGHARRLVEQAVEYECYLSEMEQACTKEELMELPAYQSGKRALVECIAALNSVANIQRKGRDDLPVSILDAAVDLLERCDEGGDAAAAPAGLQLSAARCVAERVVESFEELRDYLHEIQHHLDLLHPHLYQNQSLVARLVRWEETWEIGARYVHHEEVLSALCFLVPQLQRAQQAVPALARMCEDCEAELFLILPRLVWLCMLSVPAKAIELVRRLLPHRFHQRNVPVVAGGQRVHRSNSDPDLLAALGAQTKTTKQHCVGPELQALTEKFWRTEVLLTRACSSDGPSAWDILVQRAANAAGGADSSHVDPYAALVGPLARQAAAAADDLLHDLEAWSMELQRHSPEDWNECINVLVQCLVHSDNRQRPAA